MCDPVHGIMELDNAAYNVLKSIIDSALFQRLRHIKQLSFAEYVYPGAVHTRFNHCIGAAYLANLLFLSLEKSDADNNKIKPNDRIPLLVASLLHDIGHGPLSHAFENAFSSERTISHEEWNLNFITQLENMGKINKANSNKARKILSNKREESNIILHQIISSQLDVDRFDYLLRDSHFCGVSYGKFDVNWLISCIKICNDNQLAVTPKGARAVEHYLMARRMMNHNVYYHKTKCAVENMMSLLINSITMNEKNKRRWNLIHYKDKIVKFDKNKKYDKTTF